MNKGKRQLDAADAPLNHLMCYYDNTEHSRRFVPFAGLVT